MSRSLYFNFFLKINLQSPLTLEKCSSLDFREMNKPWAIWIQGKLGASYLSDIGLDSLALMEGET